MSRARRGQPRKGPDGESVTKYPALLVKIPPATKAALEALSVARSVPQWKLVDEAIRALVASLPASERPAPTVTRRRRRAQGQARIRQFKAPE